MASFSMSPNKRVVHPLEAGWHFKQADDSSAKFLPVAQFPTNVHLDLLHHGLIPDPFIGKNEVEVQWVGEKAWLYRTTFKTPALVTGQKAALSFAGLDTHATVFLNGKEILRTENMFIPERVDVSRLLADDEATNNVLEIRFDSTWDIGRNLVEKFPDHGWIGWNGDLSRLAVRKAQYQYGWDWGPKLLTCGPWRPVTLEVYTSYIAQLSVQVDVDPSLQIADISANVSVEVEATDVEIVVSHDGKAVTSSIAKVVDGVATARLRVENPELWFPHTYGKQPLYIIEANLRSKDEQHLDSASKRIGIRRARVVQNALKDQPGSSFYFEINNVPVFCGGSDWIPADSFIPRVTRQKYYDWLKLVVEGNQVMIRVWGGGIFEEPAFYEACDEMGILVWQDFMFACGNYPTNPEFLALVEREAVENVKRLHHHTCIVLWAGNNEDYWVQEREGLEYDPSEKDPAKWLKSNFPARYIYEKLLPDVMKKHSPNTYYHPGSPFGGKDSQDETIGDIHQWNVWHGTQEKYQDFDRLAGRFVSEFGLEAFPDVKTIDSFLPDGKADPDRYPQSSTVDFHNRSDNHERRIALYMVENIRYDFSPLERFVYCTQLVQAECLANAYRLWKREWRGPGREQCAGVLVWQTNDCWPVTSWAIIDYYLRPKQAYYVIKRELAPITIGLKRKLTSAYTNKVHEDVKDPFTIEMWATNLTLTKRIMTVQVKAWDVESGEQTYSEVLHQDLSLEPNRSTEVSKFEIPVHHAGRGLESKTVIAAYLLEDSVQVARCVCWPEPLKHVHLQKPKNLKVHASMPGGCVQIEAEVPVKGLTLSADDDRVTFMDNCVDVVPGETIKIGVRGLTSATNITVMHLNGE